LKYLSFRTLFLCILLPPGLYLSTLQGLEIYFQKQWTGELPNVFISDSKPLMEGRISIEEEIRKKINAYLSSKHILKWGILVRIVVKTGTGRWLYPSFGHGSPYVLDTDSSPPDKPESTPTNMLRVAENNWKIMQEGIRFGLTVKIPKETWLANGILAFYIIVFSFLLYHAYRKTAREAHYMEISNQQVRKTAREAHYMEISNQQALEAANERLMIAQQRLQDISVREKNYHQEIARLKNDLDSASDRVRETENEALTEMEQLENKLHENISTKEDLELEVVHLKEELERVEATPKVPAKKQRKQINSTAKRFKTLYKNIEIQQRAVEGFLNLGSDLQLRAEELIHNMDMDSSQLAVKRKIFSKKGAATTFECEFAYRGRVYWRPVAGTKTEILAIGTKNSQTKDLTYLENL